ITVDMLASPPANTTLFRSNLICRVTYWGMSFSEEGYRVSLTQHWIWLPFIEREVVGITVDETQGQEASCEDALAVYDKS
ncbi:MAG TPA: hypothetical protein VMU42_14015, partial [Candidatus Sulfotelmatobacter sp.]|nr:hypothetical protein [Candidatus Sulfotelmatobacter sp.]